MPSWSMDLRGCSMVTGNIPSKAFAGAFTPLQRLSLWQSHLQTTLGTGEQCLPGSLMIYGGLVLTQLLISRMMLKNHFLLFRLWQTQEAPARLMDSWLEGWSRTEQAVGTLGNVPRSLLCPLIRQVSFLHFKYCFPLFKTETAGSEGLPRMG